MSTPKFFLVGGPFEVPIIGPANNRSLAPKADREPFWQYLAPEWGDRIGCYVFGLRRAKGILPVYVGQTKKSFRDECFNPSNYEKLHSNLRDRVGTLVLFLTGYDRARANSNDSVIDDLERYLIESARERLMAIGQSELLANRIHNSRDRGFAIQGVHRDPASGRRQNMASRKFASALGL